MPRIIRVTGSPVRRDMPGQVRKQVGERLELPAARVKADLVIGQERAAGAGQHPPPPRRVLEVPHLKPQLDHPDSPPPGGVTQCA
jgi:hypothetical protein